jgi:predicted metalloprotease with PDZ domain
MHFKDSRPKMRFVRTQTLAWLTLLAALSVADAPAATVHYDVRYQAEPRPSAGTIHLELKLEGERLPSKIVLHIDPLRHRSFTASEPLEVGKTTVTWRPRGASSQLSYDFVVNHERAPQRFDSLLTQDWAMFRADKLVPRVSVTAARKLRARATLEFELPPSWSAVAAYPLDSQERFRIDDPARRFDRPSGWMLIGKLGKRSQTIADITTIVAAPAGDNARRQDTLAFISWNLPHLVAVFPTFPRRLLIVSAGDPMWRGGLSGPASLFIHSDRPLISENRTSTLLHELVHVAMGLDSDDESDWIVEGFAELYSIETLRRSGGISKARYQAAMRHMREWAKQAPSLFAQSSSGARTARAVLALRAADAEIRRLSDGRASLDDVARELAQARSEIGLETLQNAARKAAGQTVKSLERESLNRTPG